VILDSLLAQRRLGQVEPFGRLGEIELLGHGEEVEEIPQVGVHNHRFLQHAVDHAVTAEPAGLLVEMRLARWRRTCPESRATSTSAADR